MTPEEFQELNDLISPLILKGQPSSHIFAVHPDEIPVCRRTLYNYLDQRVFQARNIDLPRRIRYIKQKKKSEPSSSRISAQFLSQCIKITQTIFLSSALLIQHLLKRYAAFSNYFCTMFTRRPGT